MHKYNIYRCHELYAACHSSSHLSSVTSEIGCMPLFSASVDGMTCTSAVRAIRRRCAACWTKYLHRLSKRPEAQGKTTGSLERSLGVESYNLAHQLHRADRAGGDGTRASQATHLAQLVGRLSLRSAATGHQKAFLVEGAHDAERVVDAALVLVQGHLVAASARRVREVCVTDWWNVLKAGHRQRIVIVLHGWGTPVIFTILPAILSMQKKPNAGANIAWKSPSAVDISSTRSARPSLAVSNASTDAIGEHCGRVTLERGCGAHAPGAALRVPPAEFCT
jgi:hypothetical protein